MIVVGMQSGTSIDAIDVAVADLRWTEDTIVLRPLRHTEIGWPAQLRQRIASALPPNATSAAEICELDTLLGQHFAAAALAECDGAELIVSHGQTVFHWVSGGAALGTLQLGQPAWIAEATGLPVISDLRARDVAAGGHGAPLASTLDALWLVSGPLPAAALNVGGIANLTVVAPDAPVVAFDTGPGNCLLDLAAARVTGDHLDRDVDGRLANGGRVREDLFARLSAEPYFARPAPKSTGREVFHHGFLDAALAGLRPVTDSDLLATLTELTAATVADACHAARLGRVVASGGGVYNPALMGALRRRLDGAELAVSDELGLPASAKEAYLFALLGFLTWYQVPGALPAATGSRHPSVLGRITPGDRPLRLPDPGPIPQRLVVES